MFIWCPNHNENWYMIRLRYSYTLTITKICKSDIVCYLGMIFNTIDAKLRDFLILYWKTQELDLRGNLELFFFQSSNNAEKLLEFYSLFNSEIWKSESCKCVMVHQTHNFTLYIVNKNLFRVFLQFC